MAAQIGPNLNLNHSWSIGEDGWNIGMNENLIKLDTLNHLSVKSKSIATPPVSPTSGDRYIIPSNPTGDWATYTNYITVYINSIWQMYSPKIGFVAYIEDLNLLNIYDSSWITASGGGGLDWEVVSINTTAVKDKGYLVNATSNNVTILLPVSPVEGDSVGVCDAYNKATINIITVARNLQNIEGVAEDLVLDINGAGFVFVYVDSIIGWKIVSEIGSYESVNTDSLVWSIITDDIIAAPSKGYLVNATSNDITILLPIFPTTGDAIGICDVYGKALTHVITIAGNTHKIKGVLEDLVIDIVGSGFVIVYVDSTRGWEIVSETGLTTETLLTTSITHDDTNHAPNSNAVFDALALKANLVSPSFTTPVLGTPTSGNLANCTFPTLNQSTSGTAANLSGTPTLPTGTTLVAPVLGTPASGNLANCTFPTLNQSTSGTAANLSGTPTLPTGTKLVAPALGTPASGNLSNCTFPTLNQSTSGTSANLSGTPTLPTGTTLVAPVLGTPASGNLVNCTFPTLNQSTSGTSANLSGTPTLPTGTILVAPVLGTPASGNLANCTGLNVTLSRVNKTQSLSPVTLLAADCNGLKIFTNTGATAEVIMLLPTGADGYRVNAIITAAYNFTFKAYTAQTIRYLSTVSIVAGSIKSDSIGDMIQLDWNGTQWVVSVVGTSWQLETS